MSEAIGTKRGTITRAQGRELEHRFSQALNSLDAAEAAWAIENFDTIFALVLRRPENGLHFRRFHEASFEVGTFVPSKLQRLEDAGDLKGGTYWLHGTYHDQIKISPASYRGPSRVRFQMCAFTSRPSYLVGDGLPSGLPRIDRALRALGHPPADFHQAMTFACEMSHLKTAEAWASSYGPCRIFVLGSQVREERTDMVLVLYSPGYHDSSARPHEEGYWRLDCVRLDTTSYTSVDDWFLTIEPAT